jgi:hypothetical protein
VEARRNACRGALFLSLCEELSDATLYARRHSRVYRIPNSFETPSETLPAIHPSSGPATKMDDPIAITMPAIIGRAKPATVGPDHGADKIA